MSGHFSGMISIEEPEPVECKHKPIEADNSDPRINVLREYILMVPTATIQSLKSSLKHFSKATDNEFKDLVKSANIEKYNELYPVMPTHLTGTIYQDKIPSHSKICNREREFITNHPDLDGSKLYDLYKLHFPNSERKKRFIRDFRCSQTNPHITTRIYDKQKIPHNNVQFVTIIESLHKAGFTPETITSAKPIINELLSRNSNQDEINLAIACLKP